MNKVWETGRLTMEPNVRYNSVKNADGQTEERVVASYNLAVTRSYNQQTADFFRCIAFGKNAQFVEKYLHKGTKISICGHLQSGNYTDKDGIRRYTVEIIVEQHEFAESRRDRSQKRHRIIWKENFRIFLIWSMKSCLSDKKNYSIKE